MPAPGLGAATLPGPLALHALSAGKRIRFEARLLERLEAGAYTYLHVELAEGERRWVVTLGSAPAARPGAGKLDIVALGYAAHFFSKRLARDFDGLYFAERADGSEAARRLAGEVGGDR